MISYVIYDRRTGDIVSSGRVSDPAVVGVRPHQALLLGSDAEPSEEIRDPKDKSRGPAHRGIYSVNINSRRLQKRSKRGKQ